MHIYYVPVSCLAGSRWIRYSTYTTLFLRSPSIETSTTFLERLITLTFKKLSLTIIYFVFLSVFSQLNPSISFPVDL